MRPGPREVIVPVARIPIVEAVEAENQAEEAVVDVAPRGIGDPLPIGAFQVNVRTVSHAAHAGTHIALRRRCAAHRLRHGLTRQVGLAFQQPPWPGVDLLNDRDWADKAAPCLASPEITHRQCGDDDTNEEHRQRQAIGIEEEEAGTQGKKQQGELNIRHVAA